MSTYAGVTSGTLILRELVGFGDPTYTTIGLEARPTRNRASINLRPASLFRNRRAGSPTYVQSGMAVLPFKRDA